MLCLNRSSLPLFIATARRRNYDLQIGNHAYHTHTILITKASLLAGVGFPSGMYWGQSWGTGIYHIEGFWLKWTIHMNAPPLGGFKPSLVHVFWRGRGGSLLWREDRVMDITRVQAPNLVLSHRVDASSPGSCVPWQDAANFMTTFWSIWHVPVPSHTNAKHDNVVALAVVCGSYLQPFLQQPFLVAPLPRLQRLVWTPRMWRIGCNWFELLLKIILHPYWKDDSPQRFRVWKTFGCGFKL